LILAGSDWPPPGFAVVAVILLSVVVAIGWAIPWLWRVQVDHGQGRVLAVCIALGAGIGLVLAVGFAIGGPGEPSIPDPPVGAHAVWLLVPTLVGAVNGALVGGVTVWARPKGFEPPAL
jgi:uncharacterized membrane protein YfcA